MTRMSLTPSERSTCVAALGRLLANVQHVREELQRSVLYGSPIPGVITALGERIDRMMRDLGQNDPGTIDFDFERHAAALLRAALAQDRRFRAGQIESRQQIVSSSALAEQLQDTLAQLDQLLSRSGFRELEQERIPRLSDYVTPHGRESIRGARELGDIQRDPKHQILLSSSLLLRDLEVLREECEDRQRPLAVVFVDLDDFSSFNAALGEVVVDRFILPPILNVVESVSYGHARAYRHGGDEFVLLLPNADRTLAVHVVKDVKRAIEALTFEITDLRPQASAGIWITTPQSHLTAAELVDQASQAKKESKKRGKSRITVRIERGSGYNEEVIEGGE